MKVINVEADGELTDIDLNPTLFSHDKVILVVDDNTEKIYIWKGSEANVRKRFIASRHASGIRLTKGLTYKVESIDQDEEPNSFLKIVGKPLRPEKKIVEPIAETREVTTVVHSAISEPEPRRVFPDIKTPEIYPDRESKTPSTPPKRKVTRLDEVLDALKQLKVPVGFKREVVVIGQDLYAITEHKRTFFGKELVDREIEIIKAPPEGTFFASDYTPRVVVQGGEVLAIEFLKGTTPGLPAPSDAALSEGVEARLSELVGFFTKLGKDTSKTKKASKVSESLKL